MVDLNLKIKERLSKASTPRRSDEITENTCLTCFAGPNWVAELQDILEEESLSIAKLAEVTKGLFCVRNNRLRVNGCATIGMICGYLSHAKVAT